MRVQVVSASDGGAAFPEQSLLQRTGWSDRRAELHRAVGDLGLPAPICLGLPDGELAHHEDRLADLLTEILRAPPGTWCAATWRGDGHPDHEAVGRAAADGVQRTGAVLLEYPVWMWHWALPGDPAVPWHRGHRGSVDPAAIERKTLCGAMLPQPVRTAGGRVDRCLPPFVLRRLLAVGEVVFR